MFTGTGVKRDHKLAGGCESEVGADEEIKRSAGVGKYRLNVMGNQIFTVTVLRSEIKTGTKLHMALCEANKCSLLV